VLITTLVFSAAIGGMSSGLSSHTWTRAQIRRDPRYRKQLILTLQNSVQLDHKNDPPEQLREPIVNTAETTRHFLVGGALTVATAAGAVAIPALTLLIPALVARTAAPFWREGFDTFKRRQRPSEETLLATLFAILLIAGAFLPAGITFVMVGVQRHLVAATKDRSRRALGEVFGSKVETAWCVIDGMDVRVPITSLVPGDTIHLRAGDAVCVDGNIVEGTCQIDQQALTGEQHPIEFGPGERVLAGTQVIRGDVQVLIEKAGTETVASQIVALLYRTTEYRLTVETRAKQISDKTALYVLLGGATAFPFVGLIGAAGMMNAMAAGWVLTISTPIGMLHTLRQLARQRIIVTDGRTLEAIPKVDTVIFDKTGTLTEAVPTLDTIWQQPDIGEGQVLRWAAAAEQRQTHPLAHAIRNAAEVRHLPTAHSDHHAVSIGLGVQANVEGEMVLVGSTRFMRAAGVPLDPCAEHLIATGESLGNIIVHVARSGRHVGTLQFRNVARKDARATVDALREAGLNIMILSGDGHAQVARIAEELGITDVGANLLPQGKAEVIDQLQANGRFVCFVGDGINDIVAMRRAPVSIAVAHATAAASAAAGVLILENDLKLIVDLLRVGKTFSSRVHQAILASAVPGVLAAGTIGFLGGGFLVSTFLNQVAIASGVACFVRPLPGLGSDPIQKRRVSSTSKQRKHVQQGSSKKLKRSQAHKEASELTRAP